MDESFTNFSKGKAFKDLDHNSTHRGGEVAQWDTNMGCFLKSHLRNFSKEGISRTLPHFPWNDLDKMLSGWKLEELPHKHLGKLHNG